MEEFLENYFKEYPKCKGRVLVGDIGEEILHYIQSAGIDLVMIGTHGRKGIERIVFGSVADRVVKSSSVPVLTINPHKVK
jgi:nucleotide-binding universal stress UspA family protein